MTRSYDAWTATWKEDRQNKPVAEQKPTRKPEPQVPVKPDEDADEPDR